MYPSLFHLPLFLEETVPCLHGIVKALSLSLPSLVVLLLRGAMKAEKLWKLIRLLLDGWRRKRETQWEESEGAMSTHIYTSVKFTHLLSQTLLTQLWLDLLTWKYNPHEHHRHRSVIRAINFKIPVPLPCTREKWKSFRALYKSRLIFPTAKTRPCILRINWGLRSSVALHETMQKKVSCNFFCGKQLESAPPPLVLVHLSSRTSENYWSAHLSLTISSWESCVCTCPCSLVPFYFYWRKIAHWCKVQKINRPSLDTLTFFTLLRSHSICTGVFLKCLAELIGLTAERCD